MQADGCPSVQNSPSTHASPPQPVQNSPGTHAGMLKPVQNSPYTAKIAHFAPFSACRAKNVTLSAQALAAGRLFSRCGFEQSKLGDLWCATSGRFLSGSTSSSSRPPAWATESSLWHSHGLHVHHVAWRLGCFERNIAPAWDCACRHEILIAPTRLKPLILTLFRRAGVVFLSRRPSNTQHSGAQGWFFFHGGHRIRRTVMRWGGFSFTIRPQPRHTSRETTPAEATERRHAQQAHKTGPVIIHRPRFVCISARSACTNA